MMHSKKGQRSSMKMEENVLIISSGRRFSIPFPKICEYTRKSNSDL